MQLSFWLLVFVVFLLVVDFSGNGKLLFQTITRCHLVATVVQLVAQLQPATKRKQMVATTLRHLKKDQDAIITKVSGGGHLNQRMREMGLVPCSKISLTGKAPLNDPVSVRVAGSVLALRNNEADHIQIKLI